MATETARPPASPSTETPGPRRWYRLAFMFDARRDREQLPDRTRDAEAALALQPALSARGFSCGGVIFNHPATHRKSQPPPDGADSMLMPHDLLVLTTRPPLDDVADGVRSPIPRSHTALEVGVFARLRRHLSHCSRQRVRVAEQHALASADVAKMANIEFGQNRGAAIEAVQAHEGGRWTRRRRGAARTTMAYLLFDDRPCNGQGPAVLASFGMTGIDTLRWNAFLATKCPELVASVPFVMAEITATPGPVQPSTLADLCVTKVRFLTRHGQ